jgi:hypothetical protein
VDAVKEAQALYNESLDALSDQRKQIEEDLRFSDPSDPQQWDIQIKNKRENDPGGVRPCLVFDQTQQYVANVAGQVEQRPPALHAIPVGGGADKRVAESLDGFFRHIEHASRAQEHYTVALTSAARVGVGYLMVRPEYTDRAMGYQEPRISSEGDALRVVFDPWSVRMDGSDATFAFHLTPFSKREFERKWPKAKPLSFGEDEQAHNDREDINVVEQWRIEDETKNMVFCIDVRDQNQDVFALPEDDFWARYQRQEVKAAQDSAGRTNYRDKYRCVKWARMSGAEVLDKETEYPASSIGIVPIYGYVAHAKGRMSYCGIPRRARAAQQSYNYHMSEIHAYIGTAPKSPWMVPIESMVDENIKSMWDKANAESRAYIPYRSLTEDGKQIPPPSRTPITINLQNHIGGAVQAKEDIQAALGMYYASLGAPSNETSGVAIDSRKEQGEAATAHFPGHLAAGLGQVGKLCLEIIQRVMDTRRQVRVLSFDMTSAEVTIDPEQTGALQEGGATISINPNVGKYDARVVVGPSFSTQRQQAQQAFTEMMRANKEMMPMVAPFWAQTLDIPNADKFAQAAAAMAPPEVKAILNPDGQQSSENLKAENEQLKAALAEAVQVAEEAQSEFTQAKAEAEEANANAEAKRADIVLKEKEFAFKVAQAADASDLKREELGMKGKEMEANQENQLRTEAQKREDMARAESEKQAALQTDPEQDDAMEEALTTAVETVVKGQDQANKAMEQLAKGQEQNAKLMEQLIKLVQAPRKKEIRYDSKGEPIGSIETIDTQGPMQ